MSQTANVPQGPIPRPSARGSACMTRDALDGHARQTMSDALAATPIKCRVTIKTEGGQQTYDGLFASTGAAAIDAQERIGMRCQVSVRALP
ncbi:hypothetical protein [Verminephrobacter eiseniae]|uniref:hypothetical protein n=1 Tax=Verminephrobacter eiseniae TaxID=364317 RepID=UPI002238B286|nr:hypothetical protein [Verminephrobacter eiseniae]